MGGEGRCLAAEVRPYSELAESLSSLRVGRWGRREEGGGRGKGRSSCREQWQDSLWGRDPLLCRGPGRPHHPPLTRQCMGGGGGQEECQLNTKETPHLTSQLGTEHSPFKVRYFQSSSQQPSKLETVFIISILQMQKLRLGWPSSLPKDAHCHQSHLLELGTIILPPRGWALRGGLREA